ncbi:GNAT family N-acetyltransferase [Vibrio neptunius]|uniref:GNAT family N-acetyltransferase n=1 Tax=Vibrio neptunius TaxID=170651 RepID=UPI0019CF688E|nr:GNAT family N-acetyltransferase [Vibrio neptunius]MBN3574555.1 GNAT family N-acetyltransferase [Vibrio neptunius]QXX05799.1 GNAT family N-acetyltransferase [Vibrio neptunius]
MPDSISIEPYQDAFRPALRKLYLESRQASYIWLETSDYELSDFDNDVEGEQIWVAFIEENIAGFISLWEPENFIHHLYVSPAYIRKGVGGHLIQLAKSRYPTLSLKCMSLNKSALDFYYSQGFTCHSKAQDASGEYYLLTLG